ncbi:MAG: helix-turn-helix transcriptional regulator [Prevotellaceae bacterium]|nr:helix-turn-helix transcriptional regulator [Prevotellaceae bacterium]MDD7658812.1 helix-turn-helix transcriptional regulator [Prevotellaceae bacterium]MDY5674293.1 helix-turn-helix transcriptional regulator [Bacteroidaceae bacterium]
MCIDIRDSITSREREILGLLSKGHNSKEISEMLFLSPHTVDYHRRQLLKKTNSRNIAQLIGIAYHMGIL